MFLVLIGATADGLAGVFEHVVTSRYGGLSVTVASDASFERWHGDLTREWVLSVPLSGGVEPPRADMLWLRRGAEDGSISVEVTRPFETGRAVYTAEVAGGWACSSHIAGLREAGVPMAENTARLRELLRYRYVAAPSTLFEGISQITVGDRLRVSVSAQGVSTTQLESYELPPQAPLTVEDAVACTRARLESSIGTLDGASVRPLLSGGLDSSLLFSLTRSVLGTTHSVSTGYPEEADPAQLERQYAESAAEALSSEHEHLAPTGPQYLEAVIDGLWMAEQPLIHLQSPLLLHLFRSMSEPASTPLSGAGGDTLFGQRRQYRLSQIERVPGLRALLGLAPIASVARLAADLSDRGHTLAEIAGHSARGPLASPRHSIWSEEDYGDRRWLDRYIGSTDLDTVVNRYTVMSRFEGHHELDLLALVGILLSLSEEQAIWSKLAASTGRVLAYSFTDRPLMDFAMSVPWELKLRSPKHLLRTLGAELGLPRFIGERPKAAFGLEEARWAPPGALLDPLVALAGPVFSESVLAEIRVERPVPAHTFWSALNYAIWRRLWIDGESPDRLKAELAEQLPRGPTTS